MLSKLNASGLFLSSSTVSGNGLGSVLAFLILLDISSLVSVKLILDASDGSDLLIFFVPSLKLITRVAGPNI